MDANERQLIDGLFDKIRQTAAQAGPRDRDAAALIAEHMRRQPDAAYYMAQLIIVQRQALRQAEARIAALERQLGAEPTTGGGFLPRRAYPWQAEPAPQYAGDPRAGGGGGFLQGAMQTALGIGGGILLANAAMSLLGGMGDVFAASLWDDRAYAADLQDAYAAGYENALDASHDAADPYDAGYQDAGVGPTDELFGGDVGLGDGDW